MKKYALLRKDDGDGSFYYFLKPGQENNLVQVMENHGIKEFVSEFDPYKHGMYKAILIEYKVKVPKVVKVVEKLVLEVEDE